MIHVKTALILRYIFMIISHVLKTAQYLILSIQIVCQNKDILIYNEEINICFKVIIEIFYMLIIIQLFIKILYTYFVVLIFNKLWFIMQV